MDEREKGRPIRGKSKNLRFLAGFGMESQSFLLLMEQIFR